MMQRVSGSIAVSHKILLWEWIALVHNTINEEQEQRLHKPTAFDCDGEANEFVVDLVTFSTDRDNSG